MLLFKYKSNKKAFIGAESSINRHFKGISWPPISPTAMVCLLLLAALCWYPSFNKIQVDSQLLQQRKLSVVSKNQRLQNMFNPSNQPMWLEDYAWLTWQAESQRGELIQTEKSTKPLLFYISLQGTSSYHAWMSVLNKLFDQYSLRPKYEQIYWLENGLIDMNLQLQLVSKKLAVKDYQPLPRRLYREWPKNIEVLAALKWRGKRLLEVRIDELTLSLEQGDWVPALAANLVSLDTDKAVFRQQYSFLNPPEQAKTELILEYLNDTNLEDVNLTLYANEKSKPQEVDHLAFQYERQEDDI